MGAFQTGYSNCSFFRKYGCERDIQDSYAAISSDSREDDSRGSYDNYRLTSRSLVDDERLIALQTEPEGAMSPEQQRTIDHDFYHSPFKAFTLCNSELR